jgi:uncharacterized protein with HEPN domain
MKDQRIYCRDILERIERIERYTSEGREAFMGSELLQDGVVRCFEVIGEAVKRFDASITETHPEVIWSDFAGFRDVLIHRYGGVRYDLVWEFIQEDLPPLKVTTTRFF